MANVESPEQKKQKKMLLIFAFVVLLTIAVIYFGVFSSEEPSAPEDGEATGVPFEAIAPQEEIPSLEGVILDFSLFNDPRFTALNDFSSGIDVSSIEKGRRNPFK